MTYELTNFAARLREILLSEGQVPRDPDSKPSIQDGDSWNSPLQNFETLALELFALQLKHNPAYRKICAGRKLMPGAIVHWTDPHCRTGSPGSVWKPTGGRRRDDVQGLAGMRLAVNVINGS